MAIGAVVGGVASGAPVRTLLGQRSRSVEGDPVGGVRNALPVATPARLGRVAVHTDLRLGGSGGPVRLVPALRVWHRETMALLAVELGVVATLAHSRALLVHQPSVRGEEGGSMRHADAVAIIADLAIHGNHGAVMTSACVARQTGNAGLKVHRVREGLGILKRKRGEKVGVASQTRAVRDGEIRLKRCSHPLRGQHSGGGPLAGCVHGPAAGSSHQSHDPQSAQQYEARERAEDQKKTGHRTSSRV